MTKRKSETQKTRTSGRPPKPLDMKVVEAMAYAGGSIEEIADYCEVSRDTIERRCRPTLRKATARRRLRLRQLQMRAAEAGDKTMLVWLGKVELGQSETQRVEHSAAAGETLVALTVQFVGPTDSR